MKKMFVVLICVVLVSLFAFIIYKSNHSIDEIKYYTYEGNGKLVMSSIVTKVDKYTDLKNNYFIKEEISQITSDVPIIEVLYSEYPGSSYFTYGNYSEEEFNKYFSEQIKKGLLCDGVSEYGMSEGTNIKCLKHDSGYYYEKINSSLCVNINSEVVCIQPNDWQNIGNYKNAFEKAGWQCEYHDNNGKWTNDVIPLEGNLQCSKEKPSTKLNVENNDLFCFMGSDGEAICSNNNGWCGIGNDLNTWCFGVE